MKIPRFTSSIWKYKNYLMLLFLMLFVVIVVLSSTLERKYDLKLGEVSTYTIKAPRETLDRISTEQRVKIAREEVSAQFNHVKEVRYDVLDKLSNLFKEL
ncbi:Metal dependent phosphohydrolase [Candidatus Arthromitus sp. SFB-3]|nr:Metal dependent phosphohydrolase [Candidatus Arthromitus sp. SFB-3]